MQSVVKSYHPGAAHSSRARSLFATALLLLCVAAPDAGATDAPVHLEISKKSRELVVRRGDEVVRRYHAAYGKGGAGTKLKLGDNKTPIGVYRIVEFKSDSRFHFFMQIDYPNLLDAWHGYRRELIDAGQFRAIATAHRDSSVPPQDTALGGYIGIHGIGETSAEKLDVHAFENWTNGCIALTNEEITELRSLVAIGTRVVISE